MTKRLTEPQFQACIKGLEVGQQTKEIARGVLVLGHPQTTYVKSLGMTKGAVSQAVARVWNAFMCKNLPTGYERVSVVLPEHQAFIVNKWAKDAAIKMRLTTGMNVRKEDTNLQSVGISPCK
jgi:hypothetical protein